MERCEADERAERDADDQYPKENAQKRESVRCGELARQKLKGDQEGQRQEERGPREERDERYEALFAEFQKESHAAFVDAEEDEAQREQGAGEDQHRGGAGKGQAKHEIRAGTHKDPARADLLEHVLLDVRFLQHGF